jgi:hypothetical protein
LIDRIHYHIANPDIFACDGLIPYLMHQYFFTCESCDTYFHILSLNCRRREYKYRGVSLISWSLFRHDPCICKPLMPKLATIQLSNQNPQLTAFKVIQDVFRASPRLHHLKVSLSFTIRRIHLY